MKSLMLIDLDALLDTRTGVLFEIDPEEAIRILNAGWTTRDSDELEPYSNVITTEQFNEAYENRSKTTLANSRPTNVLKRLAPELKKLIINRAQTNSRLDDYCLVINLFPYNLSDDDAKQIQLAVAETLGENTPVRVVNYLPTSTSLSNLQMREFTDYITYDIQGWIEREFGGVKTASDFISVPEIAIWGPTLSKKKGAHEELISTEPELSEKDDPWEFLKVTFGPFVNLNWMEVSDFSLLNEST